MYLKRLELQGFKSFPEKIRLEFNKGITAVVGPNGSGKSNIADAVRWVLGEKSAKSLRGTKMEDVIFNGTANRKPLGFAEVSMVMDNSDRVLNVDFSEVTVTRRVYRSGESDYIINGTRCRAKDILELFMDTGVGKEGYSIIGQGRIDEILSTKSEDRRLLFEEAAGIVKYRSKSEEAGRKLEKQRENLVRVNDIISELEGQVGPLSVQAEKAKKAIVITDRLKLVRVNLFIIDAEKYEEELKKITYNIAQLNEDIEREQKKEQELEHKKQSLRDNLEQIEKSMEKNNEVLADRRSQSEQRDNDIRLSCQQIENLQSNIVRLQEDIKQSRTSIDEKKNSIAICDTKINGKNIEFDTKNKIYKEKSSELGRLNEKIAQSEAKFNEYNAEIISKMNAATDVKSVIDRNNALLEQYKSRSRRIAEDTDVVYSRYDERTAAMQVEQKRLGEIEAAGAKAADIIAQASAKKAEYEGQLENTGKKLSAVTGSISEKNSRYKIISELEKSYEGYYAGVKAVLSQRDRKNPDFKGICSAVGEAVTMDKQYETAVEIALGSAVQNIIAKTEEDVKKAIAYLKKSHGGRATFLPMSAVKGRPIADKESILSEKGVLGIAKDLVKYSFEYDGIMTSLLGRVIVVDNIDNGVALSRKLKYAYKIVTLDGDLFNAGGSMTGGSLSKKTAGIFSRSREIASLKEELKSLYEEQLRLNNSIEEINSLKADLDYKLESESKNVQQLEIEKTQSAEKIRQYADSIRDIEENIKTFDTEKNQLKDQIASTEEIIRVNTASLDAINKQIDSINAELEEFRTVRLSDRSIVEESNRELSALRVELNQLENDIYSLRSSINRLNDEIKAEEAVIESKSAQINQYEESIAERAENNDRIKAEAQRLREEYEELTHQQRKFAEDKQAVNEQLVDIESLVKSNMETKAAIEKEKDRLEIRKENIDSKCHALYDNMWDEYEITYVSAKEYEKLNMSPEDMHKEERKLRNDLRALGSVNMNAVEEYKAVSERYEYMKKNRDDIVDAEKKLLKIINDLEALMKKQFAEQFALIQKNFSDVFVEMFGGGTAQLKLSDSEDMLNSGIDIIVQPPGKAVQNMMLLSGGEKALTAMALLFAILKMKPSPFCILDEIEAALDDANVNRYADYLNNFTDSTQFVVITHRKGTMEAADILYGVTMQEQGVSKLISVSFEDVEKQEVLEEN